MSHDLRQYQTRSPAEIREFSVSCPSHTGQRGTHLLTLKCALDPDNITL